MSMTNLIDRAEGALQRIIPSGAARAGFRFAALHRGVAAAALAVGFSVALAGCTGGPLTGSATVSGAQAVSEVPATRSFVMPAPGGPRIIGVIERRYANAIEQEISLATDAATPGQNQYRVQVFGIGSAAREGRLASPMPEASQIRAELARAFPGVRMTVSPLFAQNDYGPFGYATGRGAGGDLCFYGWQRLGGSEVSANGSIQVRLRLCRAGASERSLLAEMYGFSLTPESSAPDWNPYGKPAPLSPVIGGAMAPVMPQGYGAPSAAPVSSSTARSTVRRSAPRTPAPAVIEPETVPAYDLRTEEAYARQINAARPAYAGEGYGAVPNVPSPPAVIPVWQDSHGDGVAAGTRPAGVSTPEGSRTSVPLPTRMPAGTAPSVPFPTSTGGY